MQRPVPRLGAPGILLPAREVVGVWDEGLVRQRFRSRRWQRIDTARGGSVNRRFARGYDKLPLADECHLLAPAGILALQHEPLAIAVVRNLGHIEVQEYNAA